MFNKRVSSLVVSVYVTFQRVANFWARSMATADPWHMSMVAPRINFFRKAMILNWINEHFVEGNVLFYNLWTESSIEKYIFYINKFQ